MSRKLIIDAQIFQNPAWHRGMGKYSLELITSLHKLDKKTGWASIEIICSSLLPQDPQILTRLNRKIPGVKIVSLKLLPNEIGNPQIVEKNRAEVDAYINENVKSPEATDYLILSLMQGQISPAFPSGSKITKLLLFYDLIPLMLHDIYLPNQATRTEYLPKISELLHADKYLAISKTVANDLALYLGVDRSRIISIDGGPIEHSQSSKEISVPQPFILMPTGNDARKNNRRAILGFELFNQKHRNKYHLVITSFFTDAEKVELRKLSKKIVFTGNVSGKELKYLYSKSEALLFPPEYEGLGLPILEALEHNKPVACSDISVFREMSDTAFHYFDPYSVVSIGDALEAMLKQPKPNTKIYTEILGRYSWPKTAQTLAEFAHTKTGLKANGATINVAVVGPNPAGVGFTGKFMQSVHAELSRLLNIHYYVEKTKNQFEPRINYLSYFPGSRRAEKGLGFEAHDYQAALYHISNSEDCANNLVLALANPDILVLHDLSLERLWRAAVDSNLIHSSRLELEEQLNKAYDAKDSKYLISLLTGQKAVVVFSKEAQKAVQQLAEHVNPDLQVICTRLPVNNLVYESVLPTKTITFRHESGQPPPNVTDFRDNEELSRTQMLISDGLVQQSVLEAMNFGVVPVLPKINATDIPAKLTLGFDKKEDTEKVTAYKTKLSQQVQEYVAAEHTQKAFAQAICEIIIATRNKGASQ